MGYHAAENHQRFRTILQHMGLDRNRASILLTHAPTGLPIAEEEAQVILLEPKSTLNTGNTQNERTVANPEHI